MKNHFTRSFFKFIEKYQISFAFFLHSAVVLRERKLSLIWLQESFDFLHLHFRT